MTTTPALAATHGGKIADFLLDNGMEGSTSPRANRHSYGTRSAAPTKPPGKSGLAHFLERLIFKATTNRADSEFDRAVSVSGGYNNALTAYGSFWAR
ncbi:insulinase family protein [Mesorhizobium sp. M1050]|uniref:insulinase family protein n=1 Tax=Mesorhizobium sp. M1050 TaxID=2957051 RepID=UPI00333A5359